MPVRMRPVGGISPVDLLVSVAVAGLSTWWWHQFRPGGVAFGLLAGTVLLWRRRYPLTVLAAVSVLTMLTATIEVDGTRLHEGMLLITLALAMYAVIVHAATLRRAVAGGIAASLVAALMLPLQHNGAAGLMSLSLRDLADSAELVVGYGGVIWAVGLSVRYLGQLRANANERMLSAERERRDNARIAVAEERARIARELHDIVAHSLSVIILQANGAAYAFDHDRERARAALRTIGATGADALDEIRQLVEMLRSDGGDPADRTPAVLDQVEAVVQRSRDAGLTAALTVHGTPPDVPGGVALAVCRIVQESLTNTLRHAGPRPVAAVTIDYRPGSIDIEVTDTPPAGSPLRSGGAGTAVTAGRDAPGAGGHGLVGMRERVALYGGTFEAGPRPDGGWRVRAVLPLTGARPVPA
ncbi:sensor histidine kinase [Actinoplanes xinjiangensis]|uniref:histidine kinase n=1 Tax=Actinoplanes xinjiangensis TaxID=512350 RepID=A0A316FK73_9ACTN|nr:histidine kinase [Actinoplanes xinjiangensis]PWK48180.1 signal transduction histidine kinase [Actinoplanes xinjiangensis]